MEIKTIVNPIANENTYIITNENSLLVIDPGSDGQKIIDTINSTGKAISAILLTHTHYDHIMSLDLLRKTYQNPPVYVSEREASWLFTPEDNLSGLIRHADLPDIITSPAEEYFQYKSPYQISDFEFRVVETPGHSIGGISIIFDSEESVISGDALFRESIGRTDLPTGNYEQLIHSIKNNLLTLPSHYKVYPGHGPSTTISHEKNLNPFLQ